MDPYYQRVETMMQVRQRTWNEISRAGGMFGKMLDAYGASCELARMNYTDCLQCGFCVQGCRFDKKRSLIYNYVPLAEQNHAEFRTGAAVSTIESSGSGYLVHYQKDGQASTVFGQRVIVAGGGIHSPALLLRSTMGLKPMSAQLGENFNHNGEFAFIGILPPEFDDLSRYACYKGMDNGGLMTFNWYESDGFTLHPGGGMETTVLVAALAADDSPILPKRAYGLEFKRFAESVYPHRLIGFSALGIADSHDAVTIDSGGNPDVVQRDRTSFDAYLDRLKAVMADVSQKTGVTLVDAVPRRLAGMTSAHLLASCRMAERMEDGVVGPDGQVFGNPNLYLCDASVVPYALGVNPALTIGAIAEQVSEGIVQKG
jgi:choline dehydrogenase-like flavoprotein